MRSPQRTCAISVLSGLMDWIYPSLCLSCGKPLTPENCKFCLPCLAQLRPLDICAIKDNYVSKHFWGRTRVENVYCLFNYYRKSCSQKVIHQIKYRRQKQLAVMLGQQLGHLMHAAAPLPVFDLIVPVPLHPNRTRERGYNQSTLISIGLSRVLKVNYSQEVLKRKQMTTSQTGLNRADRIENMLKAFGLSTELANDAHILLVDDVITTGATLEGCIQAILHQSNRKVSVATLAAGGGF